MTLTSIDEIISRMIKASGAKDQQEMLELMGFSGGLASKWKNRKSVPDGSIAIVATKTGVSFDWLKTGKGESAEATLPPPKGHGLICEAWGLTDEQRHLLDLWEQSDEISRENAMMILEKSAGRSRKDQGKSAGSE